MLIRNPDGRQSTVSIKDLSGFLAPPIAVDRDTTSPVSHINNDITTNNQTPTQSSANYMNYKTSENPVSQPIPENGSQTVDTVISNATPVLRRSSRVKITPNCCCCCLPTPMALASGGSPMFPLVVHQPASPSIWPAVQSLRRGLSTNPGATMWCVCGCS